MRYLILLMVLCIGALGDTTNFQRYMEDLGASPDDASGLLSEFQNIEDLLNKNFNNLQNMPPTLIKILARKIDILQLEVYYYFFDLLELLFLQEASGYDMAINDANVVVSKKNTRKKYGGKYQYKRNQFDGGFVETKTGSGLYIGNYMIILNNFSLNPFKPETYVELTPQYKEEVEQLRKE